MLLLTPTGLIRHTPIATIRKLVEYVCADRAAQGVQLAQLLLDPREPAVRDAYATCDFEQLAELVYLSRVVKRPPAADEMRLPPGADLVRYDPAATHDLFARTITASYEGSLDCPGLNGKRAVADVLEGHKAAGEFDLNLWFVLREFGQPARCCC